MNTEHLIFESNLFEFDWGQELATNKVVDLAKVQLTTQHVQSDLTIDDVIARYHNWFKAFAGKDKKQLQRQEVIQYRTGMVNAIRQRIQDELPDHPIWTIYEREMAAVEYAKQDCVARFPGSTVI